LTLADNGYNGLLRVGFDHPQLIITDLTMPDMNGYRMIEALQRDKQTAKITVVAVTGLSDGEIDEQGGLPEDVMVLHKPVDFSRLRQAVEDALARLGLTTPTH
jgi:CheY-like chemotaxis protein